LNDNLVDARFPQGIDDVLPHLAVVLTSRQSMLELRQVAKMPLESRTVGPGRGSSARHRNGDEKQQ